MLKFLRKLGKAIWNAVVMECPDCKNGYCEDCQQNTVW